MIVSPQASPHLIVCNDLSIYNQYSNSSQNILTIEDMRSYRYSRMIFDVDNFNGRQLNFQLLDEDNNLLKDSDGTDYDYNWIVI